MREIKFRAWDGKEMIEINSLYFFEEEGVHEIKDGVAAGTNCDYQIMQFTGAIDKEGEEVWEGDIYWNNDDGYWPTIVAYNEKDGCFIVESVGGSHDDFYSLQYDNFVKVGNIHQNPELLEQQ